MTTTGSGHQPCHGDLVEVHIDVAKVFTIAYISTYYGEKRRHGHNK